jgi:hypothetical protein
MAKQGHRFGACVAKELAEEKLGLSAPPRCVLVTGLWFSFSDGSLLLYSFGIFYVSALNSHLYGR